MTEISKNPDNNLSCNIIVICGPTASGKTRLGIECARSVGGEIVSADSRQIYRGMDIGTGKDLGEYATSDGVVPYHLIDIADPDEIYTLHDYQRDCSVVIRDLWSRGRMPVMVGGSGLYIESMLRRYEIPQVPENSELRQALMDRSKEELLAMLLNRSPDLYGKTDLSSKKRIVRAIEIDETLKTGAKQPVVGIHESAVDLTACCVCVNIEPQRLRERIRLRLESRLAEGMVDEVRALRDAGISAQRFSYFGMEYKFVSGYLCGEYGYETMVERLQIAIQQLAKRQRTYFRGMARRGVAMHWVEEPFIEKILPIIRRYTLQTG